MPTSEELLVIDDSLRFVLFDLECLLNVELHPGEVERILTEAQADAVSAKQYTLWNSGGLSVTGRVEEYEPGTLWLRVESKKAFSPSLSEIAQRAKYQVFRIQRRQEAEP